jgi:hypothetical protein
MPGGMAGVVEAITPCPYADPPISHCAYAIAAPHKPWAGQISGLVHTLPIECTACSTRLASASQNFVKSGWSR